MGKTLTEMERAALLRARTAGRYDFSVAVEKRTATQEEWAAEQHANNVHVDKDVYFKLRDRGLLVGPPFRLTESGREALK